MFVMLCVRFLHIVALFLYGFVYCTSYILSYMGRVYTLFDARMRYLRHMVSSCTLLNCVTINMMYHPTLL